MRGPVPHRVSYALWGVLLALGSPGGFLLLRAALSRTAPTPRWVGRQLTDHLVEYLYLTGSTLAVMLLLGWLLGRREDRAETRSRTDALTGLANRRHALDVIDGEVARALRYDLPLSVLLLDLDRLKEINDRSGHAAGDAALRRVAVTLQRTCRTTDVAGRIGGDEFVVLAPATTADQARELASRVHDELATPGDGARGITVSIGIADARDLDPPTRDGLLAAADRALYRAKLAGRGRLAVDQRTAVPSQDVPVA